MKKKMIIPYPKIILEPFNLKDKHTLDALSDRICDPAIKKMLVKHIEDNFTSFRFNYPKKAKEFYIVPFCNMYKACNEFSLKAPDFAVLWMPSVALKAKEIIEKSPEDLKELAIIAWDYGKFSLFRPYHVLVADLSLGFPTFVLWENNYKFCYESCVLLEINPDRN